MTATGPQRPDVVDVVALGESMVTFLPTRPGPPRRRAVLRPGHRRRRVQRGVRAGRAPGTPRAGSAGSAPTASATTSSRRSARTASTSPPYDATRRRPTGVYFRTAGDRATDAHEVAYYRAGSAASAMSADTWTSTPLRAGRVLHLTGITAALSADCLACCAN